MVRSEWAQAHTRAPAFIRLWRAYTWHGIRYMRARVFGSYARTHKHSAQALADWLTNWLWVWYAMRLLLPVLYCIMPHRTVRFCSVWALSMRNSCWHAAIAAVTVNIHTHSRARTEFSHIKRFWRRRINQLKYRVPSRIICTQMIIFFLLLLLSLFENIEKHKTSTCMMLLFLNWRCKKEPTLIHSNHLFPIGLFSISDNILLSNFWFVFFRIGLDRIGLACLSCTCIDLCIFLYSPPLPPPSYLFLLIEWTCGPFISWIMLFDYACIL